MRLGFLIRRLDESEIGNDKDLLGGGDSAPVGDRGSASGGGSGSAPVGGRGKGPDGAPTLFDTRFESIVPSAEAGRVVEGGRGGRYGS